MATETATLLAQSTRHELTLETQLEEVNDRLKAAKRRVRLVVPSKRHRTLHLRATLPAQRDEVQGAPRRRYIKLPVAYTAQGIEKAEVLAIDLNADIVDWRNGKAFDWDNWIDPKKRRRTDEVESFNACIDKLKTQFFEERRDHPRPQTSRRYWQTDFSSYFKKLDLQAPYSIGHMRDTIMSLPLKSSSRKKMSKACKALAKLMSEPFEVIQELAELGRGYGKRQLKPRDIPSDQEILQGIEQIEEEWKWAFRVLYLYGARPHELYDCEVLENSLMRVDEDSKTGLRIAMPRAGMQHLVQEWDLFGNQLPGWFGANAEVPQQNVSMELTKVRNEASVTWSNYSLRHAWAISQIKAGLNIRLASRSMGHTVREHEETYLHWISEQEMLEQMMQAVS